MNQSNEIAELAKAVDGLVVDAYLKSELKSTMSMAEKRYIRYRSKGMDKAADALLTDMTKFISTFCIKKQSVAARLG